jgi:hypothetical protein
MRVSHLKGILEASTGRISELEADVARLRLQLLRLETDEPVGPLMEIYEGRDLDQQIANLTREIDSAAQVFDGINRELHEIGGVQISDFGGDDDEDDEDLDSPQIGLNAEIGDLEARIEAMKTRQAAEDAQDKEMIRLLHARLKSNRQLIRAWSTFGAADVAKIAPGTDLNDTDTFSLHPSSSTEEL